MKWLRAPALLAALLIAGCTSGPEWREQVLELTGDVGNELASLSADVGEARMLRENGTEDPSFLAKLDQHRANFTAFHQRAVGLSKEIPEDESIGATFGIVNVQTATEFFGEAIDAFRLCWTLEDQEQCDTAGRRAESGRRLLDEAAEAFGRPDCSYVYDPVWGNIC